MTRKNLKELIKEQARERAELEKKLKDSREERAWRDANLEANAPTLQPSWAVKPTGASLYEKHLKKLEIEDGRQLSVFYQRQEDERERPLYNFNELTPELDMNSSEKEMSLEKERNVQFHEQMNARQTGAAKDQQREADRNRPTPVFNERAEKPQQERPPASEQEREASFHERMRAKQAEAERAKGQREAARSRDDLENDFERDR